MVFRSTERCRRPPRGAPGTAGAQTRSGPGHGGPKGPRKIVLLTGAGLRRGGGRKDGNPPGRSRPPLRRRPASARVSKAFAAAPGPVRAALARQTRRTVVDRGANVRRAVSTSRPTPTPDEGISIGRQATRVPGVDTYIQDSEKRVRTTSTARRDADGPVAWRPINTVFDGRGSRANAVRRDATRRPAAWGRWTATSTASGGAAGP